MSPARHTHGSQHHNVILLHRLTPFALGVVVFTAFALLIGRSTTIAVPLVLTFGIAPVLLARLLLFEVKRPAFWVFLGIPMFFIASAVLFFMFMESLPAMWALAIVVVAATTLYTENLFAFYHLPSSYQAYSLEHLSLLIAIASAFFFASGSYGAYVFIPEFAPIWLTALMTFFAVLFLTLAVFWVSKVGFETGRRYALIGAVVLTELYVVLALLPTSFVTSAAAFATFFYCYLGFTRTQVLERLTKTIVRRYALLALLLVVIIFGTAQWI